MLAKCAIMGIKKVFDKRIDCEKGKTYNVDIK